MGKINKSATYINRMILTCKLFLGPTYLGITWGVAVLSDKIITIAPVCLPTYKSSGAHMFLLMQSNYRDST